MAKLPMDILSQPWALQREAMHALVETWPRLIAAARQGPESFFLFLGDDVEHEETFDVVGSTAIIPVRGYLMEEPDFVSKMLGESTYSGIRRNVFEALADDAVRSIVLDVDSPGGLAVGPASVFEAVTEAATEKPVVSVVRGVGASAAYWIAAAGDEVVAAADAMLGSIGVMLTHVDFSAFDEEHGIKVIEVRSKNAQSKNLDPSTPEGFEDAQRMVDELEDVFLQHVAQGRGVSVSVVVENYGQGAVRVGRHAVASGLADRLGSLGSVVEELNAAAAA